MNKFVVAVFPNEGKVYQGIHLLKELHADGTITLYGTAVLERKPEGELSIKQWNDQGPLGLGVGTLVGGFIGLFGGPTRAEASAAAARLTGGWRDYLHAEVSDEFIDAVRRELLPGNFALMAEISEEWTAPIDMRMDVLGGIVIREAREEFAEELLERRVNVCRQELAERKAEHAGGARPNVAKSVAQIDDAEKKLQHATAKALERLDHVTEEMHAKLTALHQQAVAAKPTARPQIDQRMAAVREEFGHRKQALVRAYEAPAHDRSSTVDYVDALTSRWWVVLFRGVAAILFGVLVIQAPEVSLLALVALWGAYALADGLLTLAMAIRGARVGRPWGWLVFEGLVGVGTGVLTFVWPQITALVLLSLIAVRAIMSGFAEISVAVRLRQQIRHEWLLGASGVLSIAFGVLLIVLPSAGALALLGMIAAYTMLFGLLQVGLGLRLNHWHRVFEGALPPGGVHAPA